MLKIEGRATGDLDGWPDPEYSILLISRWLEVYDRAKERGEAPPSRRSECPRTRPCPWVLCRYHLALDIEQQGARVRVAFPGLDLYELPATCALDLAQNELTLAEVGEVTNLCKERVRQIEAKAMRKVAAQMERTPVDPLPPSGDPVEGSDPES